MTVSRRMDSERSPQFLAVTEGADSARVDSRPRADRPRAGRPRADRAGHEVRLRYGEGHRARLVLACRTDGEAEAREARLRQMADQLTAAGRSGEALPILRRGAAARTERELTEVERLVESICAGTMRQVPKVHAGLTFDQFGALWTSGALAEIYPDQVKRKKTAAKDAGCLAALSPVIGKVPMAQFTLADGERAMRHLPASAKESATRRHYAQAIHRLVSLAVYPAKLLPSNPLPDGFLPAIANGKAKVWLYPANDAHYMGSVECSLHDRVFHGFLDREGARVSEACKLTIETINWSNGIIRLDENKTNEPRSWTLDPGTFEALRRYRALHRRGAANDAALFVDDTGRRRTGRHEADALRNNLERIGLRKERPELWLLGPTRIPLRAHDLRATFVTISLACGRSEHWVMDRTGHKSSTMIARYKRAARTHAEANLGPLAPLYEAIPELRNAPVDGRGGPEGGPRSAAQKSPAGSVATNSRVPSCSSPSRTRTGTPFRAEDFKSPASTFPPRGRVVVRGNSPGIGELRNSPIQEPKPI